ncbi:MAG: XRE family transcriptional regulator [Propionivibrio sp.]
MDMTSKAKNQPRTTHGAASLQARAILTEKVRSLLAAGDWTQTEAAHVCGLTQPRISDLRRGKSGRFSLDSLVNIAAALERHTLSLKGRCMESTDAEGQYLVAEFMAKLAARPVKGRYPVATESSTTERCGYVIATGNLTGPDGRVALVGDLVRYPDGSESRIISGAGEASVIDGKAMALVGSVLENGDRINGPMNDHMVIVEYADEPIAGLLQPGYAVATR